MLVPWYKKLRCVTPPSYMGFRHRYKSLIGGEQYEPDEENPMIGFRGCGRYTDPFFEECFAMELEAKQKSKVLGEH